MDAEEWNCSIHVNNTESSYELPRTGGPGWQLPVAAGFLPMGLATAVGFGRRGKTRGEAGRRRH